MVLGKRAWFRVHSWLGVITGLLLFILCWSGTMATLAHEIDWLLSPTLRVQEEGKVLSLDKLHRQVAAQYPEAIIKSVHATIATNRAAYVVVDMPEQQRLRIYVNPYNAGILGTSSSFTVQRFFRSFHITLFNGQFGLYVVWLMAIPLTISFIAPLIFYKRWWQRFFVLKTDRGWRVLWSDLHKVIGLWSLWFVLVIALTSLWFLFEALRGDIGDGKSSWVGPSNSAIHVLPALTSSAERLPVSLLLLKAQSARPEMDIKTINLDAAGYFYVDGQTDHLLVRDRANKLYLDPYSGQLMHDQNIG
ncbi:MAG: PepSY-associated TM helix domain-containing protein, partial [Nitrosomonadales bacterium]|nr:PepSY-associated TM helix domain-containing protein [Nitrosomonadales bacterium]